MLIKMRKEHTEKSPKSKSKKEVKEDSETIDITTIESEEIEKEKKSENDKLEKLQNELDELKDKYLRLYSEFENFRRRTAKEKLELMQTANEDLMLSLLPVVDDFERAANAFLNESDIKAVKEGIILIAKKFQNTLKLQGLQAMDTKVGVTFDADLHDALTQIPAPKKKLKGKVIDTIEKGYYLGDKVIRHARVVTGN